MIFISRYGGAHWLTGTLAVTGCLLFTVREISKPPIAITSRTWKVADVAKAMAVAGAAELVLAAAVKTLDASAVPKAPATCCSVLTMAAPSALYFAGNWLSPLVWAGIASMPYLTLRLPGW